ncbi:MAG: translation initiation factor eIF-1A [Candidatus Bilamarchaeaceae archaeon]
MEEQQEEVRLRLPRKSEVIGLVVAVVGGSRMRVACRDGKERICRIPGRLKNTMWVREGDVVIVEPWEIEGDKKGDIVWRYTPLQASMLKQKGYI